MNAIEWTAHLVAHGIGDIHAAAERLCGRKVFTNAPSWEERMRIERAQQRKWRESAKLTAADRRANMMASIK